MSEKKKITVKLTESIELQSGIYSIWLEGGQLAAASRPGQFISIYVKDKSKLLPRPISICEIDKAHNRLRLVYRVVGEGTKELSVYQAGEEIEVLGPLGNGFLMEGAEESVLIGGGIGIPPMLELAKQLSGNKTIVLGYRDSNTFLMEEFQKYGNVFIASDDGSIGTKGTVVDVLRKEKLSGTCLFACGPTPMLKGIQQFSKETGIPAQISMEERMACGIGACLACVCASKEKDSHTNVNNKRICKDGPVFYADTVEL